MGKEFTPLTLRNECDTAACLVEAYFRGLPKEAQTESMRQWLLTYTESVIHSVAFSFEKAASNAIQYAGSFLCDPEFYERRRQRRKKDIASMRDQQEKLRADRLLKRLEKTIGGVQ